MKHKILICFLFLVQIFNIYGEPVNEPFTLVIFGGSGDLSARKLFPAIYNLETENQLHAPFAVIGLGRQEFKQDEFQQKIFEALTSFSRNKPSAESWDNFKKKVYYQPGDFTQNDVYENLKTFLAELSEKNDHSGNTLYYLATEPQYYGSIVEKLSEYQLVESDENHWSRVIVEKPFGYDYNSALELQQQLDKYLTCEQLFLIDHYLGKEGVQNLFTLRFENPLFEALWNNQHIDHVEITLAETLGIGTRAAFWEKTGTLRDVVQNHLMQVLAFVAMEPPTEGSTIHEEKIKALKAIRPIQDVDAAFVRGQYSSGSINGSAVPGYKEEVGVSSNSLAETFVAAKLFIDNPRWAEVPFYIRAGKRLAKQQAEIAITFKSETDQKNVLFIRIQPNASVHLKMLSKVPSLATLYQTVLFGYPLNSTSKSPPEAYEKLIFDSLHGDQTLFVHVEEALETWRLFAPVLEQWKNSNHMPHYEAGSWGPETGHVFENNESWTLLEEALNNSPYAKEGSS